MKFFIPLATGEQQAERIYNRIIKRLEGLACEVTASRVYKVIYQMDGRTVSDTVGAAAQNGEVVLAIFRNDVGYFICTYSRGAVWGEPIIARHPLVLSVEYFEGD